MKKFCIMMLLLAGLGGTAGGNELTELDAMVKRWVDLRTTIADEQRAWDQRQEQVRQELDLLKAEQQQLEARVKELSGLTSSADTRQADLEARREALQAVLDQVCPVVSRAESQLRAWDERIPTPLKEGLAAGLAALPTTRQQAAKQSLAERAQRVIALYTQLEQLLNNFHVTQQMLSTGEGRRQVDVLYLGLANGFAVSADDQWAAIGTPGDKGWQWTPAPEQAAAIRDALNVIAQHEPARLVELPLQVNLDNGEATP